MGESSSPTFTLPSPDGDTRCFGTETVKPARNPLPASTVSPCLHSTLLTGSPRAPDPHPHPKSLTSPLPGSRERPVPDSPIAGSRPLLTAQPSGRAVPHILRL